MICWENHKAKIWRGISKDFSLTSIKYFINKSDSGGVYADVKNKKTLQWEAFDYEFASLEEAMEWCYTIEATGAY